MSDLHEAVVLATPIAGVYATFISSDRSFARHWHDTYGFGLLDFGAQTSASGRGVVQALAGQMIATNPGEVHDGRPLGCVSRRWRMLYAEPEALYAAVLHPEDLARGDGLELVHPVFDDARMRAATHMLFDRLGEWHRSQRADDAGCSLAFEEAFADACGLLTEGHSNRIGDGGGSTPVHRVRDLLADRCVAPPTLSDMAESVGLSRFQLIRRFTTTFGMSPYAWLLRYRAEWARRMIRSGASLASVATGSGFSDQSHMTRTFVRQFGFTPGAWRRAVRAR